jgi:hypothetical protein
MRTKVILRLVYASCSLLSSAALAQSPVTVTVGPDVRSTAIPDDFIGMSFGMRNVPPDGNGAHFFSPTNQPLITLFRNVGIKHLRVGGTSVDSPARTPIPNSTDIDQLFGFVQATGVRKVIYSFRLRETEPGQHYAETNALLAKYIWDHYRQYLDCFALGNEPVTVSNPDGVNLTAYAVRGTGEHWVTLINKEHGPGVREVKATISIPGVGTAARAEVISLAVLNGDPAAKAGATLGSASISADGPWLGTWKPLPAAQSGQFTVNVPAVSATVVRIAAP